MNLSSFSMKTLAAALILTATTSLAFAKSHKHEANYKGESMAAPCPPPKMLKDGFYLGAQAGYDAYRIHLSDTSGAIDSSMAISATGWVGGLFIGYGQYLNDMFYLGGELLGNVSGAQQSLNIASGASSATAKFTVNNNYGLALLPGLRLNDTSLGYIRLGYNRASLKLSVTDSTAGSASKTNTTGGFDLGLGIETLVYDNWSVRTEYNHTWYNSFNIGGTKVNPSDNQFMLGVNYHFA